MKNSKLWKASQIRKLARELKSKAEEGLAPSKSKNQIQAEPDPKPQPEEERNFSQKRGPEFLWGRYERSFGESVYLLLSPEIQDDGEELEFLCKTLGLECRGHLQLSVRHKIHPGSYVGKGTLSDLKKKIQGSASTALAVDASLSPAQVRGMEDQLHVPVLDRQAIILSIFKHHAQSHASKLQVELAQLRYLQPRLAGIWSGLSRQAGGGGRVGMRGRGGGEKQLELDRRVIKERIAFLKKKIVKFEKNFKVQSARRSLLPRAALVGYTNAGKSTLMNCLTQKKLLAENKLFSTLDTTVRAMQPQTKPKVLISDTVGFVRDLPHDLVASFKSTLMEAIESNLILLVIDLSSSFWREQLESTLQVLEEIGATVQPKLLVLNKVDLVNGAFRLRQSEVKRFLLQKKLEIPVIVVSALDGTGMEALREKIVDTLQVTEAHEAYLESSDN